MPHRSCVSVPSKWVLWSGVALDFFLLQVSPEMFNEILTILRQLAALVHPWNLRLQVYHADLWTTCLGHKIFRSIYMRIGCVFRNITTLFIFRHQRHCIYQNCPVCIRIGKDSQTPFPFASTKTPFIHTSLAETQIKAAQVQNHSMSEGSTLWNNRPLWENN
jgi:hypothetical protein